MIAAQQYYIEYNSEINNERLLGLLPNYIPDYCLTNGDKSLDRWATLIHLAYKKVNEIDTILYTLIIVNYIQHFAFRMWLVFNH